MTFEVHRDGERLEVAREAKVFQYNDVHEAGYATDTKLLSVDGDVELKKIADGVTPALADTLEFDFHIVVEERGLEVVDPESEEVDVL